MVSDLLEGEQRSEGFGLIRVVANLAVAIGPAIGGILASISYMLLFILDACASCITAVIVIKAIPETKPEKKADQPAESILQTVKGYGLVSKDGLFMAYIIATMVMIVVYSQMYSTLSVYLNKFHGVSSQGFGYLMSMNAAMVVIMQFWIAKRIKEISAYGNDDDCQRIVWNRLFDVRLCGPICFFSSLQWPPSQLEKCCIFQSLKRLYHFSPRRICAVGIWLLMDWAGRCPTLSRPLLAGLIMDNYDPELVWYWAGLLSLVAIIAFGFLRKPTRERFGS